jgi:hypothetical protein
MQRSAVQRAPQSFHPGMVYLVLFYATKTRRSTLEMSKFQRGVHGGDGAEDNSSNLVGVYVKTASHLNPATECEVIP